MSTQQHKRQVSDAIRTLAWLKLQTDQVRLELAGLNQDLSKAQCAFDATKAAQLLEANEQLVLAALQAQSLADTAASNLDDLTRTAKRDPLTGIPTRALMRDRLEQAIALGRRHRTRLAVFFIDLDHFKQINDTLGHAAGDEALKLVAQRLESVSRGSDTVSRHSGDEFLVLLENITQASDAALIAAKMLSAIGAPSQIGGQVLQLSASLGIAVYPEDGGDAETLILRADQAMYAAKRARRGSFRFHDERASGVNALLALAPSESERQTLLIQPGLQNLREANEQLVIAAIKAQELDEEAEAARHRQTQFLAMVAHELRNPLAPITAAAALLDRASDDAMRTRVKRLIVRQVGHMSRLIGDLLDSSRVSTGKFTLERCAIDLATLFPLSIEACLPTIRARHQHLETLLPNEPLRVQGDLMRLAQVFSNLLENASKYTQDGGRVSLSATVQAKTLVITVADTGIGITPEALPHVFDLFVQGTRDVDCQRRGLGIGLAVVRELVEGHGGSVQASSAGTDQGSQFVVTLPRDLNTAPLVDFSRSP